MFNGRATWCATLLLTTLSACAPQKTPVPSLQPTPEEVRAAYHWAATPGRHHRVLDALTGKWDATSRFQMTPGAPIQETKASASIRWILGGRYVQDVYHGSVGSQPFVGVGLTGYDKLGERYVSIWTDSMSTAPQISYGTYDQAKGELRFAGKYLDPVTKQEQKTQTITRLVSKDKLVFELYDELDSGEMFKTLEITYQRRN